MTTNSKLIDGWNWWRTILGNYKVVTSGTIIAIVIHNLVVWKRIQAYRKKKDIVGPTTSKCISEDELNSHAKNFPVRNSKVAVNSQFFAQIKSIFKILIPPGTILKDRTILTLVLHTIFLLLRTYLSLVVARVDGRIVRDLVNKDAKKFFRSIGLWFAVAVPATYTNSMIKYLQSKLTISFRTKLVDYCHSLYLGNDMTFYKLLNLDRRVEGPDQYITSDISRFSESLAGLYSNLGKPTLDLIIFNYQLSKNIGLGGTFAMMLIYTATVSFLRKISPPFGKLVAQQTQLEGEFRGAHSRLITNAEEVAFYHGGSLEKTILDKSYLNLIKHINSIFRARINYNMLEDFVIKYCWSAVGLVLCAVPVFKPHWLPESHPTKSSGSAKAASRTQDFITNKRLMMSLGDAGGRIMYSYKELAELAGYTHRVYTLISTLHLLRNNKYDSSTATITKDELLDELFTLDNIKGQRVIGENGVCFEHVPIVTPNPGNPNGGDVLVKDLNLNVKPGEHLLITGPNGVGKTAIARVLAGLWPVFSGQIKCPEQDDIFFVPQKPYLSLGNLREQIIYPHTQEDMQRLNVTDDDLLKILKEVHLEHIPEREGGFDTIKEWKDVFSGGEKQRLGMSRLFYHKAKFAILDECTSAVSSDVEGLMYNYAKETGITLITISHRPSLLKYHNHLLKLEGGDKGKYELSSIGSDELRHTTISKEIIEIKEKLKNKDKWQKRLDKVNAELKNVSKPEL